MPPVETKKRNSILGSIALLLAAPAVALNYFDFPGLPSVTFGPIEMKFPLAVAAAVTTLAVLSVLLAGKSRRTGTEIPVAATLIGAAAIGLGYFRHPSPKPTPAPPTATTPAPIPTTPPPPARSATKPPSKPAPLPNASNVTSQAKSLASSSSNVAIRQRNLAALRDAESKFDSTRDSLIKSLESDPAYSAAKSESDSTLEELKKARAAYPPGNPTLSAASQTALAAHDKLQTIIDAAVDKDPGAREAKDRLEAAKAALKRPTGANPK